MSAETIATETVDTGPTPSITGDGRLISMELEKEYRREQGSGSGCETAYTVEARMNYHEPAVIAGQIFDNRWRRVDFKASPMGVPAAPPWLRKTIEHGMLGYSAAQALRWWIHALADSENNGLCLETRLIKHRITYSHKVLAESAHDHIHGKNRSNIMPDWGKERTA